MWVTPMSYLELLGSFKRQLTRKRAEVGRNRSRLQVGVHGCLSVCAYVTPPSTAHFCVCMQASMDIVATPVVVSVVHMSH